MPGATMETLQALLPTSRAPIMDLVADAGIDVSGWSRKQNGGIVENPRANPQYCYEWSFGRGDEPRVLCIWHKDLSLDGGDIVLAWNAKDLARRLDTIARDRFVNPDVRSRAQSQCKRAAEFDFTVQRAWRLSKPVRVVLLTEASKSDNALGSDTSKVDCRRLDSELWTLRSYSEDDGSFVLVRGAAPGIDTPQPTYLPEQPTAKELEIREAPPAGSPAPQRPAIPELVIVDQFDERQEPESRDITGRVFVRAADVRQRVLQRSEGRCELCGAEGFRTAAGAIYLETHHVIPLSEGGPDLDFNVVALCASDHRRAHYSFEADDLRARLITFLSNLYPLHSDRLAKPPASIDKPKN